MKKINLKKWDKIEIEWIDSVCSTRGWSDINDFPWKKHYNNTRQIAMGYYTNSSKDVLSISQVHSCEDDDMMGVFSIPIGCIKKIRRVK